MPPKFTAIQAVRKKLNEKQNGLTSIPGILGNQETGLVNVPDRPNYVYVTVGEGLVEAYNNRVASLFNLEVLVGYDPLAKDVYQVLSTRPLARDVDSERSMGGGVVDHHKNHEWLAPGGGNDTIRISIRQFLPLRVERVGGMFIGVNPGIVYVGGAWRKIAAVSSLDLTDYIPVTTGKALYALITVSNLGVVTVTAGSEVDVASLTLANVPATPTNHRSLAAVRLFCNQTVLAENRITTDIIDLRFTQDNQVVLPLPHHTTHEDGGDDEISVAGLSGILADAQNADHLQGVDVDGTTPTDQQLLQYNGTSAKWEPTDKDPLVYHHTSHENGGDDEVNVGGLSGVLADAQNADHLQGVDVDSAAPSNNQVLAYDSATTKWKPTDSATVSYNPWERNSDTWEYSSADDPTYVMKTNVDRTTVIFPGMRVRVYQSTTVLYFIVTKVEYSSSYTYVTMYGGTDYDLANSTLTSVDFSVAKCPLGFPATPEKWMLEVTDSSDRSQSNPANGTWYNLGSLSISIPIGVWDVEYVVVGYANLGTASGSRHLFVTLSTANNSESDSQLTSYIGASLLYWILGTFSRKKFINLSSKTTYYINMRVTVAGLSSISFLNSNVPLLIRYRCAYL